MKTVAQLHIGETAVIDKFTDNFLSLKLLEMGCLPGEKIKLKRIAPLGDPLMVSISGYSLTLRKSEAETILVITH